ncbi:helix-turn-helix domain-containing protein [Corynebacterium sp. SCR221107]|uniref:helix-turn-helix domain-containing protein n=1 Tax=Corynebacterium sp. SCR221107 TaxID=3017361 RepID=UPI0022EC2FF2|nr:helix-turn-helix domain-containing protein [Corynebacterium sp. SCR221107]WBT09864.1 helix-turn-helix domain-containing protein [Corynebacterium sp. SCR221107]
MTNKRYGLTELQIEVLEWIKAGQPADTFADDDLRYRGHARRLERLGLVEISGSGDTWKVKITSSGEQWPNIPEFGKPEPRKPGRATRRPGSPSAKGCSVPPDRDSPAPPADAAVRHSRRVRNAAQRRSNKPVKVKQVQTKETFMRYRVQVTRVQVAERWVRAADEEDAARKVQEEFNKPYGYYGSWKTTTSEVEVIEAEQTTVIKPSSLADNGPLLLSLKQAGEALGLSYSMVYELVNQGELEHVQVSSRKYVSRETLKEFIKENTHRGYHYRR